MTPEARAARERKQKIFVLVGGLLLLAMLAFQLPKLLGGSSSSSSTQAAATDATTSSSPIAQAQSVAATANGTAAPLVAPGMTATGATPQKLTALTVFARKDPFVQQAVTPTAAAVAASPPPDKAAGDAAGAKAASAKTPTKQFSTSSPAASMTIVMVNGVRQLLDQGTKFPATDPLFVLVSTDPKAKSAVVGVVGGSYASGDRTATLKLGKPLTLVNTTTGAQYRIKLLSVGTGDVAIDTKPKN